MNEHYYKMFSVASMIAKTAIECDFPIVEVSQIAERESWRKEINRPIYHIHKWWAIRLGSVFRGITLAALSNPEINIWQQFYEKHNFAGKIVLDPFMGSGTTLGEAIKLGAKAIGSDINPISTFLVRQAFTPTSEANLWAAFKMLEQNVAHEIKHYYQTCDPISSEMIPVLYFFWVKILTTPDGEVVPLFSKYVFSQNAYPHKKPKAQIVCPFCWNVIEDRYDVTDITCSQCKRRFNPQHGPVTGQYVTTNTNKRYRIQNLFSKDGTPPNHKLYAIMALRPNGDKIYLPVLDQDVALYKEAHQRLMNEDIPLPTANVRPGHNTNQARSHNYLQWRDFFNARQLLCLGLLLREILRIENIIVQEQMLCLFSSTLEFNNLFCSFKGEGTGAVRHMFSNHILKPERTPIENSIWGTDYSSGTFSTLFKSRLLPAKLYLHKPFEIYIDHDLIGKCTGSKKVVASKPIKSKLVNTWNEFNTSDDGIMIMNRDSSQLPIPNISIDAIITDPPYFDFVHYSELSDFFFAWLSPILKDRYSWFACADSSNIGEVQHKNPRIFASQLTRVFTECCRVLKDDGVLAFSFHHSKAEGWAAIHEAITQSGLAVVAAYPVHAELRASSVKTATKDPISLDAILVCRKKFVVLSKKSLEQHNIIQEIENTACRLEQAGLKISSTDRFVIGAAQTLVIMATHTISFDEIKLHFENIRLLINTSKTKL